MAFIASDLENLLHLTAVGDYRAAHGEAMARLSHNKDDVTALCVMGQIAADHDNSEKAQALFVRAGQADPKDPVPIALHARLLSLRKDVDAARLMADRAGRLAVQYAAPAFISDMIGVVLSRCGLHEAALPHFARTIDANPDRANPHYNYAASLQFSGHFERAETHYEAALTRNPKLYRAWSSLIGLRKQTEQDDRLATLKNRFDLAAEDADARLHLGHAIAKTLEDLGKYEESLDWLHRAKAEKRLTLGYDFKRDAKIFAAAGYITPQIADIPKHGQRNPVFVTGLPRTGTTLVDRILSSHSLVGSMGELNIFAEEVKRLSQTKTPFVMDAETVLNAAQSNLTDAGQRYLTRTADLVPTSSYVIDKMPLNFFQIPLILAALPSARVIVLRRGAMDSCLSNYRQLFSTAQSYYGYTFDIQDTARYYAEFDRLMSTFAERLPPDRFMQIRYEDIVHDQKAQTSRLLDFCGLPFEEACLRFHENTAPVSTASSVQVRQPLYSGSIGRWKRYGDKLDGLHTALGSLAE